MKTTKLYSAIDLHSNNLFVAIVDAQGRRIKHGRLFCELHEIEKFLRPYQSRIVDGLQDLGYRVLLAKPAELTQYDGPMINPMRFFWPNCCAWAFCPPAMCVRAKAARHTGSAAPAGCIGCQANGPDLKPAQSPIENQRLCIGLQLARAGVRTRWVTERIALFNIGLNIRNQGARKTSFELHSARRTTR
jgi:hypothetical protein